MGKRTTAAWLLWVAATACGGGGGSSTGNNGPGGVSYGTVRLLSHQPAAGEVQVALGAEIVLRFDAPMALDSFGDQDTWLRPAGGTTNLPGSFRGGSNGRVTFQPSAALLPETDYEFQLSGLTFDLDGRIVDVEHRFTFRTIDSQPPQLVSIDVAPGATNQSQTRTFTATFSEGLDPSSVDADAYYLRDAFNRRYSAELRVDGASATLDPHADLPGDRQFTLVVGSSVRDRAGNRIGASNTVSFSTAVDLTAPAVVSGWPPLDMANVSPLAQPTFAFDKSMDPDSVEATSLSFTDEFDSIVPFAVDSTKDQRHLRLRPTRPLLPGRRYTLEFRSGGAAATDVSGNPLAVPQARSFTTGTDEAPPTLVSTVPAAGDTGVPSRATLLATFDEALDPGSVTSETARLTIDGQAWPAVVDRSGPTTVRLQPVLDLPPDRPCAVTLLGGQDGVRDVGGNALASDLTIAFRTSADAGNPTAFLRPEDGSINLARDVRVSVVFDAAMAPATLTDANIRFTTAAGAVVPGRLELLPGDRAVAYTPTDPLAPQQDYQLWVRGGALGVRRQSGVWFQADMQTRFRTGSGGDTQPPAVTATFNGIPVARQQGLLLPDHGFTIDISANDANGQYVDMSSWEIELLGPGPAPTMAGLARDARIGYGFVRATVPADAALAPGDWTLRARCRDLSGNVGATAAIPFAVATADPVLMPFERTQLVWVRADMDRDSRGGSDFDDDLRRLGLSAEGDPAASNAFLRQVVLDGVLAQANRLYGRGRRGEPLDADTVPLRFTTRQPVGLQHTQIALGGLDPEGDATRAYGADTTGVLGRAYFDYRNGNVAERNTTNSPGLGVFPAEMWLYQTKVHIEVWPAFQTQFAQRFRPLCPDMGGVPAGTHPLDVQVLRPDFDFANANGSQRARWLTVMSAADDWATVIGIILAHEVGHSVGLVAPGPAPRGLYGDSSLHNTFAGAAEVMAPAVGYEAMTTLDYAFRDIDLAYLRQRLLLR